MKRKYLLKSSLKTARISRLIAKAIDLFIVFIFCAFFYPLGSLIAIAYLCICDSLQGGQSVGKKFVGFAVISLEDGLPCNVKQSSIRNLPFIVPLFFTVIPFWGWIFSVLVGLPLMGLELYLMFKLDSSHRLGDVMADTTVIANDQFRRDIMKKKSEGWFDKTSTEGVHKEIVSQL